MRLRALEPIDVDTLYRWENDPAVWGVGSTLAPYSRKQLWDYIDSYDGDIFAAKQLRLMIELPTGETIGTVDLYDFDAANSRCAVGILIAHPTAGNATGSTPSMRSPITAAHACHCISSTASLELTIPPAAPCLSVPATPSPGGCAHGCAWPTHTPTHTFIRKCSDRSHP